MRKVVFANANIVKVKKFYEKAKDNFDIITIYPELYKPISNRNKQTEYWVIDHTNSLIVTQDPLTLAAIIFYSKKHNVKVNYFYFDGEKEEKIDNPENLFIFYNNEFNKVII